MTHCATTTPVAGMEETARLILMTPGKTAPLLCSAGVTSMMANVMANVTALGVSMMALIAKDRKDNATLCMTSIVKTTMLMVTVTRDATMLNVNGMVWTVPTTCQRSWQMDIWCWWSTFPQSSLKIVPHPSSESSAVFSTPMLCSAVMPKENQ